MPSSSEDAVTVPISDCKCAIKMSVIYIPESTKVGDIRRFMLPTYVLSGIYCKSCFLSSKMRCDLSEKVTCIMY